MVMDRERIVFSAFIKTSADFAGEPIKEWYVLDDWYRATGVARPAHPFDNRPDVICITQSNRRIGVELKAWLNEVQIAAAKRLEMFEEAVLNAIGELPRNQHRYIRRVWLRGRPKRFHEPDAPEFKRQIFVLLGERDAHWPDKQDWDQSCREIVNDLSGFPILDKYLDFIELFPRREPIEPEQALNEKYPDRRWIAFPNRGGAYTLDEMLTPLAEVLIETRTDERYRDICKHVGLDECSLLVHYDFDAFAYNTPIKVPNHSFNDIAEFGRRVLGGEGGFFKRIYLLNCLHGAEAAYLLV